jgi:hypothetical protein
VNQLQTSATPARLRLDRHTVPTTGIDVDYFCRTCKGHYSRTTPIRTLQDLACRCGSHDLLVYSVASDGAAPLRAS